MDTSPRKIQYGDKIYPHGWASACRVIGGKVTVSGVVVVEYTTGADWTRRNGPADIQKYKGKIDKKKLRPVGETPELIPFIRGSIPHGDLKWDNKKKAWRQRVDQTNLFKLVNGADAESPQKKEAP